VAIKRMVQVTDDLDPSVQATNTVRFGLDRTEYEIDLSEQHTQELRSALEQYIQRARRVDGRRGRSTPRPRRGPGRVGGQSPGRRAELAELRQWAATNGVVLGARGRLVGSVLAAYDARDVAALRAATGQQEQPARSPRRGRVRKA
jgi:Lsr2